MTCTHLADLQRLSSPKLSQSVHREECTQCFDNQDGPQGIEVCLSCFNGGCTGERHHMRTHLQRSGHRFTLNVKRKPKPSTKRAEDEEPPAKISKLAIVEEREEDKYEHITVVKCWTCDSEKGREIPEAVNDPKVRRGVMGALQELNGAQVKALVDETMSSLSSARQSEVKAWEEEFEVCEHTLLLQQTSAGAIPASGLAHCTACELTSNLWLCLTCGSLGCGRVQYGGVTGGNGHGLQHFEQTGHPVSVKLGTITPEGGAGKFVPFRRWFWLLLFIDIYCYQCNDARLDPALSEHLITFGINVKTAQKTEKSMTEMQIEHNLKYDFSLTTEDGRALEPVFGPGLTGLSNLGNSCYMASCPESLPADCVECQTRKVADGLLSGRYSHPAHGSASSSVNDPVFQEGLRPTGFKALIGKGHEEFSTMKQQDSEEFLGHLITVLRRDAHKYKERAAEDATAVFTYGMEQRLQCGVCSKVSYRTDAMDVLSVPVTAIETGKDEDGKTLYAPIPLVACLDAVLTPETLEYGCPSCGTKVHANKHAKFATFPEVLVVHAKKFQLVNWVPTKLDIPIILPDGDELVFDAQHLGLGLQPNEVELPSTAAAAAAPQFDVAALAQLEGMGFPTIRCQKALLATGNSSPELAMEWLFAHMEDPGLFRSYSSFVADFCQISMRRFLRRAPQRVLQSRRLIRLPCYLTWASHLPRHARRSEKRPETPSAPLSGCSITPDDTGADDAPSSSSTDAASAPAVGGTKDVPAKYKLKAFISHKGPSVHSGHYVAHIRTGDGVWVLFNDEKVVKADEESVKELKKLAYLYVFEKV
ncbi:Ubiquitin carboxyl-terminal hydrolase [Mycena sanguinolenta]|uniref:Ubiquitin carboxyl-terminal hydrolase n=1 Tax=Mycena sanguinolenta TaxID=230812 RepID=A0A8H7D715_9AGAR|nr:Ubiquitin carboxyl-terminal hydrolase [Mycena sanguinolenta]